MMSDQVYQSDGSLIAAALAGEERAFSQLARKYQLPLFRAARSRLGDRQLAEDAVQEALLCAFRWLHTYDSRYSFRTWLWTILLNQCTRIAQRRSKGRSSKPLSTVARCPSTHEPRLASSPFEQLLAQENVDRLHELLARLPETQADALRLRFFGGLKFEEIAQAMECSVSGAKNRVRLGLTQLAAWLNPAERQGPAEEADSAHSAERVAGDLR
jgi:RNA polymerase sigma-70 factor (ECF subfamily)